MFKRKRSFRLEVRRQMRLAIASAIGFTIAYGWKEAIFDGMERQVARLLEVAPDHFLTHTYTATILTLIGVLLIFVTARVLRD